MSLFSSVLSKVSETLIYDVRMMIEAIDEYNQTDNAQIDNNDFIFKLFYSIDITQPKAQNAIRLITSAAEGNPTESVRFLSNQVRDLIKKGNDNIISQLAAKIRSYNQSSKLHQVVLIQFGVFYFSIFISSMLSETFDLKLSLDSMLNLLIRISFCV